MNRSTRTSLSLLALSLALGGCSGSLLESKRIDYKSARQIERPLEIPPDLTAPQRDDRFAVPDVSPRGVATYSAYSADRAGQPATATASSAVLTPSESMRIERAGTQRWLVVGGSWGATLALAYACRHPGALHGLLLRGLFVPSPVELDWFFQGAQASHPEAWARFAALAPAAQRTRLLPWLAQLFAGDDTALQARATLAWRAWEHTLAGLPPPPELAGEALQRALDRCRVMAHYLAHGCWIEAQRGAPGWGEAAGLRGLPIQFLHGGQDQVCRAAPAWAVHQGLPGSRFGWVAEAGHDPYHPAMAACMAAALDGFAAHGRFPDALNAPRAPA